MRKFLKDESGAAAAEYGLILAIVTVGTVAAITTLSDVISTAINEAAACISGEAANGQDCPEPTPDP